MELKEYQRKALDQTKLYLELLSEWRKKAEQNSELEIDFPAKAWDKAEIGRTYRSRKNGLGEPLPNFCLKVPTGGGKTLLAVKALDLINTMYLRRRAGLILWVVPTNQIYRQTIKNLRDREHPYRQHLDIASGGRTLIVEKTDRFTPLDVEENLVVLMLMLPSAARKSKETLKVFKDNGGFTDFFPAEDDRNNQEQLLQKVPNLDTFGDNESFWGRQIKTSLGNALRLLSPVIVLDEGHKAYSEIAQETLRGFNPALILELSATPTRESNVLVDVRGMELNQEEMIKLDLRIINKASPDWKDTMLASVERRNILERKAKDYEASTGVHIRPICLIQVERTGKDQRGGRYIHSEDVREFLVRTHGIPAEQVAVTSAELKEIQDVDLLAKDCPVRYIITKQALQEGWDCSFAYLLTVLTNPTSQNAMTQLVGRILRQPHARKTRIGELDESYVFTFRQKAANLVASVRKGFALEGLGDLAGRIVADEMLEERVPQERAYGMRERFQVVARHIVLPVFVVTENGEWRPVNYDTDIAGRIQWDATDVSPLLSLHLSPQEETSVEVAVGLSEDEQELIRQRFVQRKKEGGLRLDSVFLTRHLLEIVPNPWIAYQLGEKVMLHLLKKYGQDMVINNFVFIIEELRKNLAREKDRLAREVFHDLLTKESLRFLVIGENVGYRFRENIVAKGGTKTLTRADAQPLQQSLFEFVPEEDFNETEKEVAWYLEDQDRLFFWYRNMARQDYWIQGWRKAKIYPDFILTEKEGDRTDVVDKVYVLETKGLHLKGSEDTDYKKSVFDVCNRYATQRRIGELELSLQEWGIEYEVVYEDEWKKKLNEMLQG